MAIKFGRRVIVNGIACVVSAVIFDFLLNKKMWSGIKKKFIDFKDYAKQIAAEGAQAYGKGRNIVVRYRRDKTPSSQPEAPAPSVEKEPGPMDKYSRDDTEGLLGKME